MHHTLISMVFHNKDITCSLHISSLTCKISYIAFSQIEQFHISYMSLHTHISRNSHRVTYSYEVNFKTHMILSIHIFMLITQSYHHIYIYIYIHVAHQVFTHRYSRNVYAQLVSGAREPPLDSPNSYTNTISITTNFKI